MKPIFMTFTKKDLLNFFVVMTIAIVIIPYIVPTNYWYVSILIPFLCLALAGIGQQIIIGYTGQLALGAAGFMAAGAFACFNLILRVPEMPFLLALILSGFIASAFGILFGLPSLRVRGIYLMVATLASQFFIVWMIDKFGWFKNYDTSGIITVQKIVIMGKPFTSPVSMYLLTLGIVTLLTLIAMNLARGSTGRKWMAVRDMDIAAESMGVSLLKTKLQAFAISSFYCGVAGALFAFTYLQSLEPAAFSIKLSFQILFIVILGGLGTINGVFIGTAFILLFPVLLNIVGNKFFHGAVNATLISSAEQMVFGALMIIFMIFQPLGMAKMWENLKQKMSSKSAQPPTAPGDLAKPDTTLPV